MAIPTTTPASFADPFGDLIDALGADPRVVHLERMSARPAALAPPARPLPAPVLDALGVDGLWSHQAEAIDLLREGRSVAVATGTASGKSLCYQAPIAEAVLGDERPATALVIVPTKALAQDQLRAMAQLGVPGLIAAAYDGDCSTEERTWVRRNANVVLTNPDMLHAGLLPSHERWATFLMRLRYVVVDELHILRGVFGSHVAHVLRRLRRLCAHHGADPQFVFTSATIAEPGRLASELCGLPVAEVLRDGSPRGERLFTLWNPLADEVDEQAGTAGPPRRRSSSRDSAPLTALLIEQGRRTITFSGSRRGTEVLAAEVRRRLPANQRASVQPYRGGYLPSERRAVEAALFAGELRGVVATNALELGIDVGGLDAVVLDGFPGTIASMWQRAGRAGRGTDPAVSILVAGDDQLDQWLMTHPGQVFTRSPEPAVVNVANPYVSLPHLACAAHELPLASDDERWWPGLLDEGVRRLVLDDALRIRPYHRRRGAGPVAVWAGRGRPAQGVGLRSGGGTEVRIVTDDRTLVGTVDAHRARRQVHPGAIYLHQGRPWRVEALDLDESTALVRPAEEGEHTQPRTETQITVLATDHTSRLGRTTLALGDVRVRSQVVGYRRIETRSGRVLGGEDLHLEPHELDTRAFWVTFAADLVDDAGLDQRALPGALHALEHAAIGVLPLFAICDRWDVGGVSTVLQLETGLPTVVIHDAQPGGAGLAELGHDRAEELLHATLEVITSCRCGEGCPSCVQSPKCGNGNEPLHKAGAAALLTTSLVPGGLSSTS